MVFVIVVAIALAGYWVWQRNQTKTTNSGDNAAITKDDDMAKGSLGKGCTAGDMKGKLYTAPKAVYAICIPNGWKLLDTGSLLIGEGTDLVYTENFAPKIETTTEGKDGAFEFSIGYSAVATGAPAGLNTVGQFKANNVTGTEYARTETKTVGGLGGVPKGTLQHAYYFDQSGKSLEIDYNLFPGDIDHTDEIATVAKTLIFN